MRYAATAAILFALGSSMALGISKSYDVVPYGGCVAEIVTAPNDGITQYYRNTLDSLTAVSVWLRADTGEPYQVTVYDSMVPIAQSGYVDPLQKWGWVSFPLTKYAQPVRGRTYRVHVTRNNHPISFVYDPTDPYKYGHAVANGSSMPSGSDLALRVTGLHDTRETRSV